MPTLSYPAIPVTANVGDVYTLTGLGEGNASDTLVPGPSPTATLPYFAGDLTGTTSDDIATSIVPGTVPETFTVTILAVPAEPFVAVTLSDGATSQEYDFTVTSGPVLAPGATGLLTSIVKVSGP